MKKSPIKKGAPEAAPFFVGLNYFLIELIIDRNKDGTHRDEV